MNRQPRATQEADAMNNLTDAQAHNRQAAREAYGPVTRDQANRLAAALIDTIAEAGSVPESYVSLAAEQVGLGLSTDQVTRTLDVLIGAGLFSRGAGPTIGKGWQFGAVAKALGAHREARS